MRTIRILFLCLCGWLAAAAAATAQETRHLTDTIPFELAGGKIIIRAKIDNKPVRFIVDTGGRNIMVRDSAEYYGLKVVGQRTVGDANNSNISFPYGSVNNLKIGTFMKWDVTAFMAVPNFNYFKELGVVGALGGESFSKVCVTFDRRAKHLIINYPYRPAGVSRADGLSMDMGEHAYTRVPMQIGGETVDILFDTGMSGFLSVDNRDFETLKDKQVFDIEAEGQGFTSIGITGFAGASANDLHKIDIPEFRVGSKTFTHVGSLAQPRPRTIMGQDLLEYGRVMVDYPRGLFYFFPYDAEPTDMRETTRIWNITIMPVVDHFEVTAVVGDLSLEVGERVWKVAGHDLSGAPLSDTHILELLEAVEGGETVITVGPDAKNLREITVRKI